MIGKILGGRYEIIEKIGDGGMAVVYKAHCCLLKRDVAVKILRSEYSMDEDFVEQFKKESLAAASLSHHNIVNVYDVGEENGMYYIVMEYIKGQTLKDFINKEKVISVNRAARFAVQICSALEHAHKNNVIHRDIKPQNIVVTEDEIVKVADFGIAKIATSQTITAHDSSIMGSVHYFSPEQATGGHIDKQTDIYSLGIVLFELVTGKLPFTGETPISIAMKHINEEPQKPSAINPKIPDLLNAIILKAIDKDKHKRYKSAEDINKDLRQLIMDPEGSFIIENGDPAATTMYVPVNEKDIESFRDKDKKMQEKINNKKNKKRIALIVLISIVTIFLLMALGIFIGSVIMDRLSMEEVEVPNVIGLTEEEARERLEDNQLVMVIKRKVHSNEYSKDVVISQNPEENALLKPQREVEVEISLGPSLVTVPRVVNITEREAKLLIEENNLVVGKVVYNYNEYPENYVYEQNPKEGISVEEGTSIDLNISKGVDTKKVPVPNLIGQSLSVVETLLGGSNLKIGETKDIDTKKYPKGIVVRQSIEPNTQVDINTQVDVYVSTGEYPKQTIEVVLPTEPEAFSVKILMVKGNEVTTVYSKNHTPEDSPIEVAIQGEGTYRLEVYINEGDIPYATKEVVLGE